MPRALTVRSDYEQFQDDGKLEVRPGAPVIGLVKAACQGTSSPSATLARGEVTLSGSNPTVVSAATTGLASIDAGVATIKSSSALGDDPVAVSVDYAGSVPAGVLRIFAWKNADGVDPTLVASTNASVVISWIAIGVPVQGAS